MSKFVGLDPRSNALDSSIPVLLAHINKNIPILGVSFGKAGGSLGWGTALKM